MKEQTNTLGHYKDSFSARIYVKRHQEAEELHKLDMASQALAPLGINFSIGPSRYQDSSHFLACVISVHIDREITSRGAGRPSRSSGVSLQKIYDMLSSDLSPREIANVLEMSPATYYRRLKEAKQSELEGQKPESIPF